MATEEKEERFYVDERTGCVAVRDRMQNDPEEYGLNSTTQGVIKFWSKKRAANPCPTCGHLHCGWESGTAEVAEAQELADRLNQGTHATT